MSVDPSVSIAQPIKVSRFVSSMYALLYSPLAGSFVALMVGVGLWQLASNLHYLVASPLESWLALYHSFADGEKGVVGSGLVIKGTMWDHLWWTVRMSLQGMFFAILIGVSFGLALGYFARLRRLLADLVYGFATVPKSVLFPIILLIFMVGGTSEMVFIAIGSLFPIIANTMVGVQEVRPILLKVGKTFNVGMFHMVTKIILPAMAPSLVTGLRLGFSLAVIHAVIAELFVPRIGLGTQIWVAYEGVEIPHMFGTILLTFSITALGNVSLWYVERRLRGKFALLLQEAV